MTTTRDSSASETRPRLVCRIVRLWCAVSDAKPEHASTCASCRVCFAAAGDLESALRRDAAPSRSDPVSSNPTFEQQILRAVRNSSADPARVRSSNATRIWALGGMCTAVAAVAVVLSLRPDASREQHARNASAAPTDDAAVIIRTVESLSTEFVTSVIPSAGKLAVHNPLQEELGSVYSDMRSALDFLALNFLPATPVPSAPPPPRQQI
jgi:hypothetical protein